MTTNKTEKNGTVCILAEKPSVAREIAAIVGAAVRKDGYMEGNGYIVTWALGHLVQLAMPEHYGIQGFRRENLPVLPAEFKLIPRQVKNGKEYKADPGALKQLKVLEAAFNQCERIIVATDAGREGELIHRYIYSYLKCQKPFDRLWISSLTEKAIKDGLQNLKEGAEYDNLYYAAKARSEADYLIGINSSQALSIAAGQGIYSLGRVQTPTLGMVCSRYLDNKNFTSVLYWELMLDTSVGNTAFAAVSKERITTKAEADNIFERQKHEKSVIVESVEKKEVIQEPPLPYDLTTLQKEANTKHGFSADKTLSFAQTLYEKALISYPRTGSRYISDDIFSEIPGLIEKLTGYERFSAYAGKLRSQNLNTHCVNSKKVTDHHALLITSKLPENIHDDERKIYEMVAGRMLEAFSCKCVKDQTTVLLNSASFLYIAKGSVTRVAGWREVLNETIFNETACSQKEESKEEAKELPPLEEGQELPINKVQSVEKQTKPKPLHTESSLLAAMETAAREVKDEGQRQAMKNCGIGTPATRAAIIETLFSRDYMQREKKSLVPTEKGLAVYEAVKDKRISDVEMTGMWENAFSKIEKGEADAGHFKKGIEVYTAQITEELLNAKLSLPKRKTAVCPKCRKEVTFYPKVAKCSNSECGLMIFTTISGKTLSEEHIRTLLSGRQTAVIKGFKSKAGKLFDAALQLDETYKIRFVFAERKKTAGKKRRKK